MDRVEHCRACLSTERRDNVPPCRVLRRSRWDGLPSQSVADLGSDATPMTCRAMRLTRCRQDTLQGGTAQGVRMASRAPALMSIVLALHAPPRAWYRKSGSQRTHPKQDRSPSRQGKSLPLCVGESKLRSLAQPGPVTAPTVTGFSFSRHLPRWQKWGVLVAWRLGCKIAWCACWRW